MFHKVKLVGEELCRGKENYKSGDAFSSLVLAPTTKYCLPIDEYGILQENKMFKGFNNSKKLSDRSEYFEMIDGKKDQLFC